MNKSNLQWVRRESMNILYRDCIPFFLTHNQSMKKLKGLLIIPGRMRSSSDKSGSGGSNWQPDDRQSLQEEGW